MTADTYSYYRDHFDWRISDFESVKSEELSSPVHTVATDMLKGSSNWRLLLFPGRQVGGDVGLYLRLCSSDSKEIDVKLQFSIIDNKNHQRHVKCATFFRTFTVDAGSNNWGFRKYIKRNELISQAENLLEGGELHIRCSFEIKIPPDQQNAITDLIEAKPDSYHIISKSMLLWQKFVDQKYTDVKFVVDSQEFNLHKIVMSACPVFASMFDSELKEGRENQVTITDMEPEVFKEMVRYIYTGNVENFNVVAKRLIIAADKYAIEELVKECELNIEKNLSVDNAAETLQLAELLGLVPLKEHTLQFIKNHAVDVMQTDGYRNLGFDQIKEVAEQLAEYIAELKRS